MKFRPLLDNRIKQSNNIKIVMEAKLYYSPQYFFQLNDQYFLRFNDLLLIK